MKKLVWVFVVVTVGIVIAATSEARGGRAFHKIPKSHRHKSPGRCLMPDKVTWIKGCR